MKKIVCEEIKALGRVASDWFAEKARHYQAQSAFVPAGRTPEALYEIWRRERPPYLKGMDLVQVDDVLTGPKKGIFKSFLEEHLSAYKRQIKFIDDGLRGADLAVLGLGLNGHVAFHEPGLDESFFSGSVRLSEITCDHLGLERGTWGVSYGAGAFLKSRAILMMVSGSGKRQILERLLHADPSLPATSLTKHSDFTLLCDREAVNGLDGFHATV
jgi:6-phosphogluconolactonase/glucosamine-6-phosphate isomerase/deaminase